MKAQRQSAPAPGPAALWTPPTIERERRAGADILLAPTPGRGLFEFDLAFRNRALDETRGHEGLLAAMAMVLDRGTGRHSAREIAAAAEEFGGSIGAGVGWESASLSVSGLSSSLDALLDLTFEVATDAVFPEGDVTTARARRLADFSRRRASGSSLADAALARVLRGPGRDALPLAGLAETVTTFERHNLVACHEELLRARPLIVAVGDFDQDHLLSRVEQFLVQLTPSTPESLEPTERAAPGRRIIIVDRPEGAQTELRIGHGGVSRLDPRRGELMLLDGIVGGAFGSRVNLELRERLGLTYGARSSARSARFDGTFEIAAAVDTDRAGLAAERTLEILAELKSAGPSSDEVETVRRWRLGSVPYSYQSLGTLSSRCFEIGIFDLETDDLARTLERLATVQHAEVVALARDFLDPKHAAIVAVGPAAALVPQFERLGKVEVWPIEALDTR